MSRKVSKQIKESKKKQFIDESENGSKSYEEDIKFDEHNLEVELIRMRRIVFQDLRRQLMDIGEDDGVLADTKNDLDGGSIYAKSTVFV